MKSHELYRFYSQSGTLLYVGITDSIERRFGQHRSDKPWWQSVAAITIERFPDRDAAAQAEVVAIQQERPRYKQDALRYAHG